MTHFPNPGLDPHAEAIDGPPKDLWPADSRLTDTRVRATPKRQFLLGDDQWGGDLSHLDRLDGLRPLAAGLGVQLPRPVRADSLRDFEPVTQVPHTGFGVRLLAVTVLLAGCTVLGLAVVGFAHLAGWSA